MSGLHGTGVGGRYSEENYRLAVYFSKMQKREERNGIILWILLTGVLPIVLALTV